MATASKIGGIEPGRAEQSAPVRLADLLQHGITRLFYGVLGVAGVLMWLLMQLPLGARAKNTLVAIMAGCFGVFALGWRLLAEQAAGMRRN